MSAVNLLSVEGLGKRFGERLLFEDLTFGLSLGQKTALIARNGTGKSTLLDALTGREPADTGRVSFQSGCRFGFLAQEPDLMLDASILDNIYAGENEAISALHDYEAALATEADGDELQRAYDRMDQTGAWDFEARAKEVLGKLNLHNLDRVVRTLSGGERRRIDLARILIEAPDLLFLDEPTNHLDLEMIGWLEKHLAQARTTLLMVTHDRYFLENVCDTIFELDDATIYKYKGNYSYFLEKRSERVENALASRDRARRTMRRELDWMRSTPSARTGKSKARIDQFYELKKRAKVRLEEDPMHLVLNPARLGGKMIELHNVSRAFTERPLFAGLTYHFKRSERIGIVGANGSGKSSLLDLIVGVSKPDTGKVVIGDTVVFGHYHQHGAQFPEGLRVLEAVQEIAEFMPLARGQKITAAQLLERFLFPRHMHHQVISLLSGGERKRLHLLQILMRNPNFLVLDEPTNDLDIFTLQVLEEFLLDFPGCLIIVSHDRYFMDRLVEHVWVLGEEGKSEVRDYPGNYSEYRLQWLEKLKARAAAARAAEAAANSESKPSPVRGDYSNRLTYKEKYELEQLLPRIEALEKEKTELNDALLSATAHDKLTELSEALEKVSSELDEAEFRWLELSEKTE